MSTLVGAKVKTGIRPQDVGKIIKVLPAKAPSPGGYVVENESRIWFVAPWDKLVLLQQ